MSFKYWIHHLLDPHCPHCEEERAEAKVCRSCDTLKIQLELANHTNRILIDKITRVPETEPVQDTSNLKPITPRFVPWRIRQQTLEAESKKHSELLKQREEEIKETKAEVDREMKLKVPPIVEEVTGIEELEEELDLVEKERESQVGKSAN